MPNMVIRTMVVGLVALFGASSGLSAQPLRPTSNMHIPRAGHAAVLLDDGRVLVVGGTALDESCGANLGAELYDPSTGTWSLSDGIPIVVGRGVIRLSHRNSQILVSEGEGCGESAHRTAILDPATNAWLLTSPLSSVPVEAGDGPVIDARSIARTGYTATRLRNGSVLITGGRVDADRTTAADIYVPEIAYESAMSGGRHPGNFIGKPWGIATNSRAHSFMSECSPSGDCRSTQLFEWAPPNEPVSDGRVLYRLRGYIKEIGSELNGMAHAVRVDRDGNIWEVSQEANAVLKFNPEGQPLMRLFQPSEAVRDTNGNVLPLPPEYVFGRPTDIAWDTAGNLFVSDAGKARVVKYARDGHYITTVGSLGKAPGQLDTPHSIAADTAGNVYVADHGNSRIQVFDNNLTLIAVYEGIGKPWALCITPGPHQYLFSSSNLEADAEHGMAQGGEVYKLELDGTIIGRFGRIDNPQSFPTLHAIDCAQPNQVVAVGGVIPYVIRVQP